MSGKNVTDSLLAESFKELALRHPIEKITVKEITDKAGVIRPTFYNHFQDKYELLEWIIRTELLEPVRPLIENRMMNEALRAGHFAGDYHEKRVRPHLEISMAHAGAHFRVLCPVDVFRGDCVD